MPHAIGVMKVTKEILNKRFSRILGFFEVLESQARLSYSFLFSANSLGSKGTRKARGVKRKGYIT